MGLAVVRATGRGRGGPRMSTTDSRERQEQNLMKSLEMVSDLNMATCAVYLRKE